MANAEVRVFSQVSDRGGAITAGGSVVDPGVHANSHLFPVLYLRPSDGILRRLDLEENAYGPPASLLSEVKVIINRSRVLSTIHTSAPFTTAIPRTSPPLFQNVWDHGRKRLMDRRFRPEYARVGAHGMRPDRHQTRFERPSKSVG